MPAIKLQTPPPGPAAAAASSTGPWRQDALPSAGSSRLSFSSKAASKPAEQIIKHPPSVPSAVSVQALSDAPQPLQSADAAAPALPALALSNVKIESESAPWSSRSTDSTQAELNSSLESPAGMQIPCALILLPRVFLCAHWFSRYFKVEGICSRTVMLLVQCGTMGSNHRLQLRCNDHRLPSCLQRRRQCIMYQQCCLMHKPAFIHIVK